MTSQSIETLKTERVESLVQKLREFAGKSKAGLAESFVRNFFTSFPPEDIEETAPLGLYKVAQAMWSFVIQRTHRPVQIKTYSVLEKDGGWSMDHSVFEIMNDDMPFLVDTITGVLNRHGYTVRLVIHPVVCATRDKKGNLTGIATRQSPATEGDLESWIQVYVNHEPSADRLAQIAKDIEQALADTRAAVTDWPTIRSRAQAIADDIGRHALTIPELSRHEAEAFLRWLDQDNFTFLGYREFTFEKGVTAQDIRLILMPQTGLGVLRDDAVYVFDGLLRGQLTPEISHLLKDPQPLILTKTSRRSTVHRTAPMDAVFIKKYDAQGKVVGLHLLLGLFTSAAYARSAREIPYVRQKVADVVARAGFDPKGHSGKALIHILETYPRDELFHTSADHLYKVAIGVLHLQERQRSALFVRQDPFERSVSCLIYVPRERYSSELRGRIHAIIERAFQGKVSDHTTHLSDSAQARLHTLVATTPGQIPAVNLRKLEKEIAEATRIWGDFLQTELTKAEGDQRGSVLARRYGVAFPVSYRDTVSPYAALADIDFLEQIRSGKEFAVQLSAANPAAETEVQLKVYHARSAIALSDVLPFLESMDLKVLTEMPYEVKPEDGPFSIWIHEFKCLIPAGVSINALRDNFHQNFLKVWSGEVDNDSFNRLILRVGLNWREVVVLRSYAKYLRQARFPFAPETIADTLATHRELTRHLVQLFHFLHDPVAQGRPADIEALEKKINSALKAIASPDDDAILRRYLNLIRATLRTNFYQTTGDGLPKAYVSFKLNSQIIDELPLPRPWVEIFVYSPRMESIHLRGGKVARGGIRWSDRREDFRTEVLGLMKAQMVKNTVIVPVGSKGGFVVKKLPPVSAGRDVQMAEVTECYKTMMRGMLDITDNLVDGKIVPPAHVTRRDADDPYLVVAADKGTATFSDTANSVSMEYGFWLGDAFASGGSKGYDHKKMGITARGVWEAVKRHFRELGLDTQSQDFTVVGVGDMSGDVFGNGMLQSKHIKLLGAFDHRHIFCDPNSDPAVSYVERERMFKLPRSSWADYDKTKISKGGAIFERTAKLVTLTPEIKECFGLTADEVKPSELVRAMLKSPVDMLWFGGIGTFIKASTESHADAGDKTNDSLRVDGRDIRAKMIGEGANLGMTQAGRVEYALKGGCLNTDAIDNSAGVDTSDHEVNIKILLNDLVRRKKMSLEQRDKLLVEMTDEVAGLVLRDNYLQTQALTMAEAAALDLADSQMRLMRALEKMSLLDRGLSGLPSDEDLVARKAVGKGLTRPENAVLLAYSKIALYDTLLSTSLPDDATLLDDLVSYFPTPIQKSLRPDLEKHRLKREIVATSVTNDMINRMGATFVHTVVDKTGFKPEDITRAYRIARDVFDLPQLWRAIEQLDLKVAAAVQTRLLQITERLVSQAVPWLLIHGKDPLEMRQETAVYHDSLASVAQMLAKGLDVQGLTDAGVPADLARRVGILPQMVSALDIVRISRKLKASQEETAHIYFALGNLFSLEWLREQTGRIKIDTPWQQQAVGALADDLFALQGEVAAHVLAGQKGAPDMKLAAWTKENQQIIDRIQTLLGELRALSSIDIAMLTVISRYLRELIAH